MADANSKLCRRCGESKPFSEFHKSATSHDGAQSLCKPCKADAQRRYRGTPPKDPNIPTSVPAGQSYCSRCKCIKPSGDFAKSTHNTTGLHVWCRECNSVSHKNWRESNANKPPASEKHCPDCGATKPASDFSKNRGSADGLCYCCKPCWALRVAALNAKDPAGKVAKRKAYAAANKDKKVAYKAANSDKIRAQNKAYAAKNKAKYQKWREENAESIRAHYAEYRKANRDRLIAVDKEWRKSNQGIVRRNEIARLYNKLQATPAWSDLNAISAVYIEAKRLEELDGAKRHVDHIVPIKHKLVCGLHVPANLQILTAFENQSKGNRFKVQ